MLLMYGQSVFIVSKLATFLYHLMIEFTAVNCTEPPERPPSGTWEWNGNYEFGSEASYTCGFYGKFQNKWNEKYETLTSTCGWNRSWVPEVFDPCVATSCQYIPFPPPDLDMVYIPDEENSLSLLSDQSIYNPKLPLTMKFPGPSFCENNGHILMIVGEIPEKIRNDLEIIFLTQNSTEPFHMQVDLKQNYIKRWGGFNDLTEVAGTPYEGTTIDYDEPFMLR